MMSFDDKQYDSYLKDRRDLSRILEIAKDDNIGKIIDVYV